MSPVSRSRKQSKKSGQSRQDRQRQKEKAAFLNGKPASSGRYWHGGRAGLEPGTVLVPRAVAEREGADLLHYDLQPGYDLGVTDAERVYFSSSREFARSFAGRLQIFDQETGVVYEHGSLYEVEPLGEIEKDSDFDLAVSWCAPAARIVAVEESNVRLHAYEVTERIGPYMSWVDGSPIYTDDGHYLPSPEQIAGGYRSHPLFQALRPWTPVEFVNAWGAGQPSGNRPNPADHPRVRLGAAEAGPVLMKHVERATALMKRGVDFSTSAGPHLATINQLLAGRAIVREDDDRGVIAASHPRDGLIGAMVITGAPFGPQTCMFIDAIAVAPTWQRKGLGSVLLLTAQRLLPASPSFAAGHCDPNTAPFFAQAGYTVLRPGTQMPLPLGDEPRLLDGTPEDCWFYRQGPV